MTAPLGEEALAAIEALIAKLDTDEYNQGVPKNAPWQALRVPGTARWRVYQPISPSGDYRVIADELRAPFAEFIAAARSDVPRLVAALSEARRENERLRKEAELHALCNDGCVPGAAYRMLTDELDAAYAEVAELRAELERKGESIENRDDLIRDLRGQVGEIREARSCLGAGPMDYEAFVDVVDEALRALGSGDDQPGGQG